MANKYCQACGKEKYNTYVNQHMCCQRGILLLRMGDQLEKLKKENQRLRQRLESLDEEKKQLKESFMELLDGR